MRLKQVVCSLVSIYFDSPQLSIQQNFLRKESGNSFSTTFCVWFFKKNVSHVIFYNWPNLIAWLPLLFWDIGQYVYCNCLLTTLWRRKFWNQFRNTTPAQKGHVQSFLIKTSKFDLKLNCSYIFNHILKNWSS